MSYYVVWLGHQNGIYDNWGDCQKQVSGFKGAIYKKFESVNEAKKALSSHPKDYVKMNISFFTTGTLEKNKKIARNYQVKKSTPTKNKKTTTKKSVKNSTKKKNVSPNQKQIKKQVKSNVISETERIKNIREMIGLNIDNVICVDGSCVINEKVSYAFGKIEYQAVFLKNEELIFRSKVFPKGTNNIAEFLALVNALKYVKENELTNAIIYTDSLTALGWINKKTYNTNLERNHETEELFIELELAKEYLINNPISCPILKWQTGLWGENPADFNRK